MPNEEQKEYWNDSAGQKWVEHQDYLDGMLSSVTQLLTRAAAIAPGERALDIGCGTGEFSVLAANAGAVVTGVDVSQPMLELGKPRLAEHWRTLMKRSGLHCCQL